MFSSRIRLLFVLVFVLAVGCRRGAEETPTPAPPTAIPATVASPLPATPTAAAGPVDGETATPGSFSPTFTPSAGTAVPPTKIPPAATEAPRIAVMPFGPFHLPSESFADSHFTGSFQALSPETAVATLEAARKAGASLVIHLTGSRQTQQTVTGALSPEKFAQELAPFQQLDLESYVADGTVVGHLMFDEPQDPTNWDGSPVPYRDIEAAAAASKALWPSLPVGVGGPPSYLVAGAPWTNLDFAFAQYTTRHGDIHAWLKQELNDVEASGLGLALSINVLGGNNRNPVTAEQLLEWGSVLAAEPKACALLMWKYDVGYYGDPAILNALSVVAEAARQRTAVSCTP